MKHEEQRMRILACINHLEQLVSEPLEQIDQFNRDGHKQGLTLQVNGVAKKWPVDAEDMRVLAHLLRKTKAAIESGDLPSDADLDRLLEAWNEVKDREAHD